MASPRIKIGTTFYSPFADDKPLWKVVRARSKGVWYCEVQDSEWEGASRVFVTGEIQQAINLYELSVKLLRENEKWWGAQKVGSVLHYCNGFSQYVRGVVVQSKGKNMLKPTALVGDWEKHDLPRRAVTGEVFYPYHAGRVINNHLEVSYFQPNASNIYEHSPGDYGRNPLDFPPINLYPPSLSPEGKEIARLERLRADVTRLLTNTDVRAALSDAHKALEKRLWPEDA